MPSHHDMRSSQHGFTLIELLIAVLVLSIGLLGLAALQAQSLRSNQSSYHRTQATILAYDMIDRTRANRVGFDAGAYHLPTATESTSCLTTTGCSPANMAEHDMYEWNRLINDHLPGGQGVVCRDSSPDDGTDAGTPNCNVSANANHVVKLWWDDNGDGAINLPEERVIVEFTP